MGTVEEREFNLDGFGPDKRLIEGPCGHCHFAVAFKEPDQYACLVFKQVIQTGDDEHEELAYYFIMGICPRPRCQKATIIHRQETTIIYQGYPQDTLLLQERVIFPVTSHRPDMPEEVPATLRDLHREAASIEHLSPNGSAFLARRILEQTLREYCKKPRAKLVNMIDEFLQIESPPAALYQMMHDIREFGNIAGHPARGQKGEWITVDPVEASYTLDVVQEVMEHIYVKPARRQAMSERWESKKRGESPVLQSTGQILVGGCNLPSPTPTTNDDEIPF